MRARLVIILVLVAVALVVMLRTCVVIVPADAPDAEPERDRTQAHIAPPGLPRLHMPVAGIAPAALVDTYSHSREAGHRVHDAIDIMAPRGTAVLAAAPGNVEKIFTSERGGKTLYIRSPDRLWTYYYAHLDSYAPGLVTGMRVAAGQPLGTVGSTGNAHADAPHLHFAIHRMAPSERWFEGAPINPYSSLARQP